MISNKTHEATFKRWIKEGIKKRAYMYDVRNGL